jgi:hypothetical protein
MKKLLSVLACLWLMSQVDKSDAFINLANRYSESN